MIASTAPQDTEHCVGRHGVGAPTPTIVSTPEVERMKGRAGVGASSNSGLECRPTGEVAGFSCSGEEALGNCGPNSGPPPS